MKKGIIVSLISAVTIASVSLFAFAEEVVPSPGYVLGGDTFNFNDSLEDLINDGWKYEVEHEDKNYFEPEAVKMAHLTKDDRYIACKIKFREDVSSSYLVSTQLGWEKGNTENASLYPTGIKIGDSLDSVLLYLDGKRENMANFTYEVRNVDATDIYIFQPDTLMKSAFDEDIYYSFTVDNRTKTVYGEGIFSGAESAGISTKLSTNMT